MLIADESGTPLPGIPVTLVNSAGDTVWEDMTDPNGQVLVHLSFNKENYTAQWTLSAESMREQEIGLLTTTPIVLKRGESDDSTTASGQSDSSRGSCFIATAAFGLPMESHRRILIKKGGAL